MLANMDNSVSSLTSKSTVSLASDVSLCAKKDVILAKFDALLKRLVGEVKSTMTFISVLYFKRIWHQVKPLIPPIAGARPEHLPRQGRRRIQGATRKNRLCNSHPTIIPAIPTLTKLQQPAPLCGGLGVDKFKMRIDCSRAEQARLRIQVRARAAPPHAHERAPEF